MQRAGYASIVALMVATGCSGDPGDPEVRVGAGELQFVRNSSACAPGITRCPLRVLADYDLTNPYYNWSIHADQLRTVALASGSNGNVSETSLDLIPLDEAPNVQMRYRSTAPFTEQDEILAFARDPEELFDAVLAALDVYVPIGVDLFDQLETTLGEAELPQAATLAYPPFAFTLNPFAFTTVSLPTVAFFPHASTLPPEGPGALPDGSGSVKAVRIVQHGRCSREIRYATDDDLLGNLIDNITQGIFQFFISQGGTADRTERQRFPFCIRPKVVKMHSGVVSSLRVASAPMGPLEARRSSTSVPPTYSSCSMESEASSRWGPW
jgi:hypothetical protein